MLAGDRGARLPSCFGAWRVDTYPTLQLPINSGLSSGRGCCRAPASSSWLSSLSTEACSASPRASPPSAGRAALYKHTRQAKLGGVSKHPCALPTSSSTI